MGRSHLVPHGAVVLGSVNDAAPERRSPIAKRTRQSARAQRRPIFPR